MIKNSDLTPGDRIHIREYGWATYLGPYTKGSVYHDHIWSSYDNQGNMVLHGPGGSHIDEIIPAKSNEEVLAAIKRLRESGKQL